MCTVEMALIGAFTALQTVKNIQNTNYDNVRTKYKNQILSLNAKQSLANAAYERQEGIEQARQKKLNYILNMGKEASKFAAGNIALSSQTAINAIDDYKLNGELDALNTIKNSEKRAQSYERQAQQYYQNAALNTFNNKLNRKNNLFSIGSNLLNFGQKFQGSEAQNVLINKIKGWINDK